MANFLATANAMREAASKLESEANNYEAASKTAKQAADNLTAQWEGNAQRVFVTEQQQAYQWYLQMARIVRQYASTLRVAAAKYEQADRDAAKEIAKR